MNAKQALRELKSLGTAQNRKVYTRHGVEGAMYGVSYASIYKLQKKIGVDQEVAEELWASGVHDARVLASMVADPERMNARSLQAWVKQLDNYVLCDAISGLAARSPAARAVMSKWTTSKDAI